MSIRPPADTGPIRKGIPISDDSAFLRRPTTPAGQPADGKLPGDGGSGAILRRPNPRLRLLIRTAGLAGALLCLGSLGLLLGHVKRCPAFTLRNVTLQGFVHLDGKEVLSLIQTAYPNNLRELDIEHLRRNLEKYNWVQSASIRKIYPSRLAITIRERIPAGVAKLDRLLVFDPEGVFLDEYRPGAYSLNVPVLVGLRPATEEDRATNRERITRYLDFLAEIDAGGEGLSRKISEVDSSDPSNLVAIPLEGSPRIQLGEGRYRDRLRQFFQILPRAKSENGTIAEVDMRYDDKVIVRPAETR